MVKDNSKLFILVLLGMLTAFGPFVTDMYLPSLPSMGEYFSTSSSMVQLGLTTSMIGLAVGEGGIVIARSIATDKFSGKDLAKMLAIIGAINGIAPVVAPIIGGVFTEAIGWQGIFIILLVLGVLLLIGCMRFRESLPA